MVSSLENIHLIQLTINVTLNGAVPNLPRKTQHYIIQLMDFVLSAAAVYLFQSVKPSVHALKINPNVPTFEPAMFWLTRCCKSFGTLEQVVGVYSVERHELILHPHSVLLLARGESETCQETILICQRNPTLAISATFLRANFR